MGSENKICFLFQSTHPRRVWLLVSQISLPTACFNPHTHEGCDFPSQLVSQQFRSFNPHTHEGCDLSCGNILIVRLCFNPHTHEGCDIHPDFHLVGFRGFNPHTHEGCDSTCTLMHIFMLKFQSTHPRRVWLISTDKQFGMAKVSIHTPTKGVTFRRSKSSFVAIRFNPHTHEGCDFTVNVKLLGKAVSIHTPTKGVTLCKVDNQGTNEFQSTHPRRVWRKPKS